MSPTWTRTVGLGGVIFTSATLVVAASVCSGAEWSFTLDPANPVLTSVPDSWQHLFTHVYNVKVEDQYFLYYSAEEVSSEGRIGLATSSDGSQFYRRESWVLDHGPLSFEDWIVQAPRVLWSPEEGIRLWYLGFSGCCPYGQAMGEADSSNETSFTRHPSNPQWDTSGVGGFRLTSACVLLDEDDPDPGRLFKQYVPISDGTITRIGLITSPDGVDWTWYGYVLEPGEGDAWDAISIASPRVHRYGDGYMMLYRCLVGSDRLGIAVSRDGLLWYKRPDNPLFPFDTVREATTLIDGDVLHIWYLVAFKGTEIRHAWSVIPDDIYQGVFPLDVLLSAHIEPQEPYTLDDLECVTEVENLGGYPELFLSYRWFRDGEELTDPLEVGGEILPVTESILSHFYTAKNETFFCVARVTDGTGAVEATTDPVTILNSPPSQPEIYILPDGEPRPNDDLAVWLVTPPVDPDGDPVGVMFEWFDSPDGEEWNLRLELSGRLDPYDRGEPEVSKLYTEMAEYWRVEVTPVEFDGVGKMSGSYSAEELAALGVVGTGPSLVRDFYIMPDLNGDYRVDGEDLLVLRSAWHKQKGELEPEMSLLFFDLASPPTATVGVDDLFKFASGGWRTGSGE